MSTPNGLPRTTTPTRPTTPSQITGKRKRAESTDETLENGGDHNNAETAEPTPGNFHELLVDILEVLQKFASPAYDTDPSIFHTPITPSIEEAHASKRTKLSGPGDPTIASLIKANLYNNPEDVLSDVEKVVSAVVNKLLDKVAANNELRLSALSRDLRAEIARATTLKKKLDNLILREIIQKPQSLALTRNDNKASLKASSTDNRSKRAGLFIDSGVGTPVLTLYGNAPQAKQLFSSLQQPTRIMNRSSRLNEDASFLSDTSDSSQSTSKDSIRENALPIGISITKVIPVHSTNSSEVKKKVPTIGELFAPPASLAPLNPPRQSRHTATRSSSVNWLSASEPPSSNKSQQRNIYATQPLSTGQWLAYNVTPPTRLSSPGARRRQMDRALSFGEPQPPLSEETVAAHNQAKEDALFRSVYSSFAPAIDNTAALVPERTKNMIWWKRIGENKYHDFLEITQPEDMEVDISEVDDRAEPHKVTQDDEFDGAVENWVPEGIPPELQETKKNIPEVPETTKEVDEILEGISELLETLNSHQRIRNLSLGNTARTTSNSQLTAISGSPTSPSPAEFDVYNMLKSQLALMISTLPPYALAKLDGDQLGALNISTKIHIEDTIHKGVMEEDEISAKTKQMATTPATTYSSRSVNASTSVPSRSNGFIHPISTPGQSVQRSSYTPQPKPVNNPSSYLPNQQYSSRPASSNHYFSGNAHTSYSSQRPISNSERYSYSASQQYSQRPAQTPHSLIQNGYRGYPGQNGASYSQQYSSPQHGVATATSQIQGAHSQRPSQPGYQQRALNSQTYGYTASSASEPSPSKPNIAYNAQPQRAAFVGQAQTPGQQRPQLYHQHSSQFGAHTPSRPANGSVVTPSASSHTYMTADEQSALMNRQKAQLAEQQKSSSRQGSGTPQPANGNPGGQQNGTPTEQQNGISTGSGQ